MERKEVEGGSVLHAQVLFILFIFKRSRCGLTPNAFLVFARLADTPQKKERKKP